MYPLLRLLIFVLTHEQAHRFVVFLLRLIAAVPGGLWLLRRCCAVEDPSLACEVFGVKFRNRIGAAAGLDRNGEIYDALGAIGLGFVEVGTITPNAQSGNPTPRAFRLADRGAILHRTGQPNRGLQSAIRHLRRNHHGVVVGCNLGCNASTPPEDAPQDVLKLFRNLYQYADYFTINVSGDDVRDAHLTQSEPYIMHLLEPLFDFRRGQNQYRPILLKISPDLTNEEIDTITDILIRTPLDGIVAANGTQQLPDDLPKRVGKGRLSGRPLTERTIEIVRRIHTRSGGTYPIIGTGGMMTPSDVQAMLDAGADLVQLCTGLIFEGPRLVKAVCASLIEREKARAAEQEQPQVE
ncbi:MAG: quinone-dependent dihydroorotate dehydrogenase [Alistipes sp.]|nr:quinone-dependent dihydroorotate dehydrogenase [Alistipes sp.]